MAKTRIKLNRAGVRALLRSQEMMNVCTRTAYKARAQLGDGYEVTYRTGKARVNASIAAVTPKAKRDNMENNSILRALK